MKSSAVLSPAARRELRDALRNIARDNQRAARGLNDTVIQASRRLGANPNLGSRRLYVPARYRV